MRQKQDRGWDRAEICVAVDAILNGGRGYRGAWKGGRELRISSTDGA